MSKQISPKYKTLFIILRALFQISDTTMNSECREYVKRHIQVKLKKEPVISLAGMLRFWQDPRQGCWQLLIINKKWRGSGRLQPGWGCSIQQCGASSRKKMLLLTTGGRSRLEALPLHQAGGLCQDQGPAQEGDQKVLAGYWQGQGHVSLAVHLNSTQTQGCHSGRWQTKEDCISTIYHHI